MVTSLPVCVRFGTSPLARRKPPLVFEEFTVVPLMVVEPVDLMVTPDPAEETVKLL